VASGFTASNAGHALEADFSAAGVAVVTGKMHVGLRLQAI
jgi:hypothetical protein